MNKLLLNAQRLAVTTLWLCVTAGCSDDTELPDRLDASTSLLDAATDAAMQDGSLACFTPYRPPSSYDDGSVGCACVESSETTRGYCVSPFAIVCAGSKWTLVEDGPCFPSATKLSVAACQAIGTAVPVTDAGIGSRCLPGYHVVGELEAGGLCCQQLVASQFE